MYRDDFQKFEGVWIGTERVSEGGAEYEASARLVFQTLFDARFLVCDYIQTVPNRPSSVAHGVFRNDELTNKLTLTWFRNPGATSTQQANAVAEGEKLTFLENIAERTTRTTYSTVLDRLSIRTECSNGSDEWKVILEGSYRRR